MAAADGAEAVRASSTSSTPTCCLCARRKGAARGVALGRIQPRGPGRCRAHRRGGRSRAGVFPSCGRGAHGRFAADVEPTNPPCPRAVREATSRWTVCWASTVTERLWASSERERSGHVSHRGSSHRHRRDHRRQSRLLRCDRAPASPRRRRELSVMNGSPLRRLRGDRSEASLRGVPA